MTLVEEIKVFFNDNKVGHILNVHRQFEYWLFKSNLLDFYTSLFLLLRSISLVNGRGLYEMLHCMTRLLLSSHNRTTEAGRWHRPNSIPRDDRISIVCDKLEDEYYFSLVCVLHNDVRKIWINIIGFGQACLNYKLSL